MMTPERAALKTLLLTERVVTLMSPDTRVRITCLFCELCGKQYREGRLGREFVPGLDMHEVIITRGNVRGNHRLMKEITESKFNAALVCNDCHLRVGHTKWATKLLAQKLVMRYGERPITEWIMGLGLKVPTPYIQTVKIAAERNSTVEFPPSALVVGKKEIDANPNNPNQTGFTPV